MPFINETGVIGIIISSGTQYLTGNVVASMLFVLLFLMAIAFMFRVPLEFTAILIFPFCLAVGSYYGSFFIPIIITVVFLSAILAKNWFFK